MEKKREKVGKKKKQLWECRGGSWKRQLWECRGEIFLRPDGTCIRPPGRLTFVTFRSIFVALMILMKIGV